MSWESRFEGREWQVADGRLISRDPDTGVRIEHRTLGEPVTVRRYLESWGEEIMAASGETGVPIPLLLATIATENGPARDGNLKGLRVASPRYREEPGYTSDTATPHRLSVGPCHVLLSTAASALGRKVTRVELAELRTNLLAAAKYIERGYPSTGWDPILVAARYNSGGIYDASSQRSRFHSPWHLRAYGAHLDRFSAWYGDSLFLLYREPVLPDSPPQSRAKNTQPTFPSPTTNPADHWTRGPQPIPLPRQVKKLTDITPELVASAAMSSGRSRLDVVLGWISDLGGAVVEVAQVVRVVREAVK